MYDDRGDPEGCFAVLLLVAAFAVGSLILRGIWVLIEWLVSLLA